MSSKVEDYSVHDVCDVMEMWCDKIDERTGVRSRPRISTRTLAWVAIAVGAFLPPVIPLDDVIGVARALRGPAVGFHEAALTNPTVHLGQPLILRSTSEYLRVCAW